MWNFTLNPILPWLVMNFKNLLILQSNNTGRFTFVHSARARSDCTVIMLTRPGSSAQ